MATFNFAANLNWNRRDSDEPNTSQSIDLGLNALKTELEGKINIFQNENNTLKSQNATLQNNMKAYQVENQNQKQQISSLNLKLSEYSAKIAQYEKEAQEKTKKYESIQVQLMEFQNKIQVNMQDDTDLKDKVKTQADMIKNLQVQIEGWRQENNRDDARILELENQLKLKIEEVALLKKRLSELEVKLPELESKVLNHDVDVQKVEEKYNIAIRERDQINVTLEIKLKVIKEYEDRVAQLMKKSTDLSRSLEDYKTKNRELEEKELSWSRMSSDFEISISSIKNELAIRDQKISSMDGIIKARETRILQLNDTIKELNGKIRDLNDNLDLERKNAFELKSALEGEIKSWQQENLRDDSKISELSNIINNQNLTIKKWQEENTRDDAKIKELEDKCTYYVSVINKLKEYIETLKAKFNEMRNTTVSLEIVSEVKRNEITKTEVSSTAIRQMGEDIKEKEANLAAVKNEVEGLKAKVEELIHEKNSLNEKLENLNLVLKETGEKYTQVNLKLAEYDEKMTTYTKKVEKENSSFAIALNKVNEFKGQVSANSTGVIQLFQKIDSVLG